MAESDEHPTNSKSNNCLRTPQNSSLSPAEFSLFLTKIAIVQICRSFGFTSAQSSALESLTKIAALYIQSIGSRAASRAAVCGGRTESNLFDVISAIEDLQQTTGFPGASNVNVPLLRSYTMKELQWFVNGVDELPFARRIPRPEPGSGSVVLIGKSVSSAGNGGHVPRWLPEFPEVGGNWNSTPVLRREAYWEEKASLENKVATVEMVKEEKRMTRKKQKKKKGDLGFSLMGRRERVKFRLGTKNGKLGADNLKLRNGVCRGGKRVCFGKRVKTFLEEDEQEESVQTEIGKS